MPEIPPFIQQIIGAAVRMAVVWLAAKFGASISEDRAVEITAQVLPIVLMIGWSLYAKFHGRQKLLTALASTTVMTEHEVEAKVSDPSVPTPSVLTHKSEVPS